MEPPRQLDGDGPAAVAALTLLLACARMRCAPAAAGAAASDRRSVDDILHEAHNEGALRVAGRRAEAFVRGRRLLGDATTATDGAGVPAAPPTVRSVAATETGSGEGAIQGSLAGGTRLWIRGAGFSSEGGAFGGALVSVGGQSARWLSSCRPTRCSSWTPAGAGRTLLLGSRRSCSASFLLGHCGPRQARHRSVASRIGTRRPRSGA